MSKRTETPKPFAVTEESVSTATRIALPRSFAEIPQFRSRNEDRGPVSSGVLVFIDDDAFAREIARQCAQTWAVEFHHTDTFAAGINLVCQLQPQIVVVSLDLVDGDPLASLSAFNILRTILIVERCHDALVYRLDGSGIRAVVQRSSNLLTDLDQAAAALSTEATWYARSLKEAEKNVASSPYAPLTKREVELVKEFALGCSNEEVAAFKKITPSTAQTYRKHIMQKLRLHCSRDLMYWAIENGFVSTRDFILRKRMVSDRPPRLVDRCR